MKKKILAIGITVVILIAVGLGVLLYMGPFEHGDPTKWSGINPEELSGVVTDEELSKNHLDITYGLMKKDVSQKDLSQVSIECISNISFNETTKWPEEIKLPKGFNTNTWLKIGKDPGLNLSKIHEKGITGKGISVAVIDKPMRSTHNEFKDKIIYTKIDNPDEKNPHFHGIACSSILAGRSCGVAKDSNLYYFSTPDPGKNHYKYYIDGVNKIIEMNKSLSKEEKIRIVSISEGIEKNDKNFNKWQETIKKANSEGLAVVDTTLLYHKNFTWGGCDPSKDRNNPLNYKLSNVLEGESIDKTNIIVPGDFRTTASNDGDDNYDYWGESGFSNAVPYVVGLSALAWQVDPNLTFDEIIDKLIETKTTTAEGRYIIDPEKFINSIS